MRAPLISAALLLPWVWPVGADPIPSFGNSWLAVLACGLVLARIGPAPLQAAWAGLPHGPARRGLHRGAWGLALLGVAAWLPVFFVERHAGQALLTTGLLLLAACCVLLGLWVGQAPAQRGTVLARSLVGAASANAVAVLVQVAGLWWGGDLRVLAPEAGERPGGLLRQPAHTALLLALGLCALAGLRARNPTAPPWPWRVLHALALALMLCAAVLCGSRTLVVWAAGTALLLALAPPSPAQKTLGWVSMLVLGGAAANALLNHYATAAGGPGLGVAQHAVQGSPSRWLILQDSWQLLLRHPWFGTGWGDFNLAWTLMPRDAVSHYTVNHSHVLPLQVLAELGLPLGGAVLALLGAGALAVLRAALRRLRHPPDPGSSEVPTLLAMLGAYALFNLTGYTLWFGHFLLVCAVLVGWLAAATTANGTLAATSASGPPPSRTWGLLVVLAAMLALWQFMQVVPLAQPGPEPKAWEQRVAQARSAWLFAPEVEHEIAMQTHEAPGRPDLAARASLQPRVLLRWADALRSQGRNDDAAYLTQRALSIHSHASGALRRRCPDGFALGAPPPCDLPRRDFDPSLLRPPQPGPSP